MVLALVIVVMAPLTLLKTANAQCGGLFTNLTGVITSPDFPNNYPNNSYCLYNITVPPGYRIHLEFTNFSLEISENNTCNYDYVQAKEGLALLTPRICNGTFALPRRSFGNSMLLIFSADDSVAYSGFRAVYTAATHYSDAYFLVTSAESSNGAGNGCILRVDVETATNLCLPFKTSIFNPVGVGFDHVMQWVYWTEFKHDGPKLNYSIRYGSIHGGDIKTVIYGEPASFIDALAVDPLSRLLFYSDYGLAVINILRLTDFSRKTIINTDLEKPIAIALDTHNGVLFWSDWGTVPKIERCNYDGTNRRTLVNSQLRNVFALTLDFDNRRLFWADAVMDRVECSDFNGDNRTVVEQRTPSIVFGMVYYQNTVYLTELAYTTSYVLGLSTVTSNFTIYLYSYNKLFGIYLADRHPSRTDPNGCGSNNGGCSMFCMPLPGNRSKCDCRDDQILLADRKTCVDGSDILVRVASTPALPFDTDGSQQLNLTCTPLDVTETVISYAWSVNCLHQTGNTCRFAPRPPEDDGKEVACNVTLTNGQIARGSITLDLNYPPRKGPQILGYGGELLEMGNAFTMTCTVRGGKPLVTSVIFSCDGHADNPRDIRGSDLVQSDLTLSPVKAEDKNQRCTCTAEWKITELYKLSAWTILNVNNTQTLTSQTPPTISPSNSKAIIPIAAGAGGGGLLLIIVIIVVIACVVKRRRARKARNGNGRNKDYHKPEPSRGTNKDPEHDYSELATISAAISQGRANHQQGLQRQDSEVYHSLDDAAVSAAENTGFKDDFPNYVPFTTAALPFGNGQPARFLQGDSYGARTAPPPVAPKPVTKYPPLPARGLSSDFQ